MATKEQIAYIDKWKKENTYSFLVRLQNKSDSALIERMNKAIAEGETKGGFIKRLIREQIAREKEQ